jgi:hypothetical protein
MAMAKNRTTRGRGSKAGIERSDKLLPVDPRMETMLTMRDEDAVRQVTWDATVERLNSIPGWEDISGDVGMWKARYERTVRRRDEDAAVTAFREAVRAELKRRRWTYERLTAEVVARGITIGQGTLSRQLSGAHAWRSGLRLTIEGILGIPFAPGEAGASLPPVPEQSAVPLPDTTVSLPDKACERLREEARLALRAGRGLGVASTVYLFSLLGGRPLELIVREAEAELGAGDPQ